jgi:hypothetical protein
VIGDTFVVGEATGDLGAGDVDQFGYVDGHYQCGATLADDEKVTVVDVLEEGDVCFTQRDDLEYRRAKASNEPYAWLDLRDLSGCQASVDLRTGRPDRASVMLGYVLAEADSLTHKGSLDTIDLVAITLAQQGRAEEAAVLFGAVDRERHETGLVIQPPDRALRKEAVQMARAALGDRWEAAYQQGQNMSLDQATDYARGLIDV